MRLSAPSSHLGCAAACAALDPAGKASLACIQSVADEQLAAIAAPAGLNAQIWLGEYQWPMEPVIDFQTIYDCQVFNQSCDKPYKGQKNWGRCTNGQTTNVTNMFLPPFQPNNYNGGEDCMVRTAVGYADNVCNEVHQCLCEWPSQTSAEYVNVIGPALAERGVEAFAMLQAKASFYFTLALIVAALPAIGLVLFVEGYFIRWKLRTAPKNDQEMKLKATQRLALRRRMLQSGLALWLGCSLLALSYVPGRLKNEASWPIYGFGGRSQDVPWGYTDYYEVGHSIWGLNALGYEATTHPSRYRHSRRMCVRFACCIVTVHPRHLAGGIVPAADRHCRHPAYRRRLGAVQHSRFLLFPLHGPVRPVDLCDSAAIHSLPGRFHVAVDPAPCRFGIGCSPSCGLLEAPQASRQARALLAVGKHQSHGRHQEP